MDQKTWRWKRKSSLKRIEEEVQMHEGEQDRMGKNLNEKLASVLLDCQAKDDHGIKNVKTAPESSAVDFPGWEKAEEADAALLKKGIGEALRQGEMANEELIHSDAAMKTSSEFERATRALQDKLAEMNKRLEDQRKHKSRADAEFSALMARLDVTEKENALLKYELHIVEKELEIKNEEMEYNRRSADSAHKQHLDGAKRIAKLEAECRKLLNVEEENRVLKAIMIRSSSLVCPRTSSRTWVEIPFMEMARSSQISRELSVTSGFDIGSVDGNSSYCSWPNALVSESESELSVESRVKNPMQHKAITVPEMRFMDDFEEMEKLALVSGSGYNPILDGEDHCKFSNPKQINSIDLVDEGSFDWLQVVLHAISEHKLVSNRRLDEILEDIEIALDCSNRLSVHDVIYISEEQSPCLDNFASLHDRNQSVMSRKDGCWCSLQEENKRLKDDLENMGTRLESETLKSEALKMQLHELEESIGSLQTEFKMLKESNEMIEDEVENQTELTVAKAKLNEIFQKCSSLEVELEYKNNCCEELEATCLDLQLQLESLAKKETPKYIMNREGKQSQNGWEITAASVKLAECQETIMNIGKQLKLLASSHDAALIERVFSNNGDAAAPTVTNNRKVKKRFSLRDRMLADNGDKEERPKSPNIQGTLCVNEAASSLLPQSNNNKNTQVSGLLLQTSEADLGSKNGSGNVGAMALVRAASKKQGVGFLRRLFLRRKKGYKKKT